MLKNNIKSDIVGAYGHTPLKFVMIALFLVGTIITGCGKEEVGPVKVEPIKKAVAPVQAVMTSVKKVEVFYNPVGKRDPFKTFLETATAKKVHSVAPASPLQSLELSTLRLVGVMILPGKKVAIIEDPSGKGYHIKVGTRIGLNDGKVVDILDDELIVEETYLDEISQSKVRRVSVKIPKEQGQGGEGR